MSDPPTAQPDATTADEAAAPGRAPRPAPPPAPRPAEETALDLQRRALRDLVALSTECATTESQIDQDFAAALEQGRKDYEKTVWTLRHRYDSTRDSVNAKHRDLLAQVQAR